MEVILIIGFTLSYVIYQAFNEDSDNKFFKKEVKRMKEKDCEIDKDWNSRGRMYTIGLKYTKDEKTKEIKVTKQGKLHELGRIS